ncbi:MAG: hypothetical protein QUS33_12530 [Dehalococcoidia bacterium]|nr:hypothetical protein [Dehalococcoidia bacterium]
MDDVILRRSVRRWHEDTSLVKVPVIVCAAFGTLTGNTYHIDDQRLLDALNGGFVAKALRMGKDFMPLTEVEAYSPIGKKSTYPCIYVRKSNILFVAERADESKGGLDGRRRAHLVRRKMQTRTEVHMPPYVVQGNVHIDVWEELLDTIDRDQRFMPLTDVRISPALTGGASAFSFVAVNKDHVAYLTESPIQS